MNIERGRARTRTISKYLYDAYKAALVIGEKDGRLHVKYGFTQNNKITLDGMSLIVPFPIFLD